LSPDDNRYFRRMIKNFTVELAGTQFKFHTMSTKALELFQVYAQREGKPFRFHMQLRNDAFVITDRSICPPEYLTLEAALNGAILNSQD